MLALLLFAACGRKDAPDKEGAKTTADAPVTVQVASVKSEQRPKALSLDGTLKADEQSEVTSVVSGRVVEVLVERGSKVQQDDPLVRLRDVDYRLAADAARAQLQQARARLGMQGDEAAPKAEALPDVQAAQTALELAERNAERAEALAERGVLPEASLEETRAKAASAREQYASALNGARATLSALDSAQVSLRQARTSASEATVRAPFAGEIANRKVSVGEYVSPQSALVTLVRTDPLRMEVEIPQRELRAARPGQTVEVTVDAVPDRRFEGTVRYVSAAVTPNSRALTVEAMIPNPDGLLRPGLFAAARLYTGGEERVSVVPAAAVQTRAGVSRVFAVDNGVIREHVVTVGERLGEEVVLTDGLKGDESVAVSNLDQLADGVAVTVSSENGQQDVAESAR